MQTTETKQCPHCDCPDRTHCQCKVRTLTAEMIREQAAHAPSVKSELEVARSDVAYVVRFQELRERHEKLTAELEKVLAALFNQVMIDWEVNRLLDFDNQRWHKNAIDRAEAVYHEAKELLNER